MALKKPTNKGMAALPESVRNKIGFMKLGGSQSRKAVRKKNAPSKAKGSKPTNTALYNKIKAQAKQKFKTWPSAYASARLVKTYKQKGGKYG